MRLLRLSRATSMLSASVFEELFASELGAVLDLRPVALAAWWQTLLGPPGTPLDATAAAARLATLVDGADFVAPSFDGTVLAPLFLSLRNQARLAVRLVLVAHAPAVCPLEWALLGPLMAPGDIIVAPSHQARTLILALNPALDAHIVVIPHPLAALGPGLAGAAAREARPRVVSLGRLHPAKLLHRQIDALHVLRARGQAPPLMEIAGDAEDAGAQSYLRSLQQRVARLGLRDQVRFVGAVRGRPAKCAFLETASALLNLSVTIEESFGKAPLEALGLGVPVIATRWNGLPETIGAGGLLVPVEFARSGGPADVSAERVADALAAMLAAPPDAQTCRLAAARCAPAVGVPRYVAALQAARERAHSQVFPAPPEPAMPAAPPHGLLARAAPLTALTWAHAFRAYLACCDAVRQEWATPGAPPPETAPEARLRHVLLSGLRWPLERLLAGLPDAAAAATQHTIAPAPQGALGYLERVAWAAQGDGWPSTRLACLGELPAGTFSSALASGLARLEAERCTAQGLHVMKAEAAAAAGDQSAALAAATEGLDLEHEGEVSAFRLRQVARLARAAQVPEQGLPALRAWLTRFPDAPDAGPVWLERGVSALRAGQLDEAAQAHEQALALLGDAPAVSKLGSLVDVARATAVLAATGGGS